jgi:ATP phosphoribosyltransferase
MEPLAEIASISSRLVVNKAAMRSRYVAIGRLIEDLTISVREAENAAT